MYIKEILEYNYSYAEYLISDSLHELICMCLSVPLKNNKTPQKNMEIKELYAFTFDNTIIIEISDKNIFSIENLKNNYFSYSFIGYIENIKKPYVKIFDFIINLEYYYPDGFSNILDKECFVKFKVDRLDCLLKYD